MLRVVVGSPVQSRVSLDGGLGCTSAQPGMSFHL
jgi:hypothetical protein